MKDLPISVNKLAKILNKSRPTIYKYLDLYNKNEVYKIPFKYVIVFDYMQNHKDELEILNYVRKELPFENKIHIKKLIESNEPSKRK